MDFINIKEIEFNFDNINQLNNYLLTNHLNISYNNYIKYCIKHYNCYDNDVNNIISVCDKYYQNYQKKN